MSNKPHASQYNRDLEIFCPACKGRAELKDSAIIYGRSYGLIWICEHFPTCNSYVGCHKGSSRPKGTLADGPTREWRKQAHAAFDALWMRGLGGKLGRGTAYAKLAFHLGEKAVHIGESDGPRCRQIIDWSRAEKAAMKEPSYGNEKPLSPKLEGDLL